MPTTFEVVIVIFMSYLATGIEMLLLHSEDFDPPAYIYKPAGSQFLYACIWPVVSYFNNQLGWFFITFISTSIVYGSAYILLDELTNSVSIPLAIITLVRFTRLNILFTLPMALIASILWFITGHPLGWKMGKNQ